jgi:hypothetical protein
MDCVEIITLRSSIPPNYEMFENIKKEIKNKIKDINLKGVKVFYNPTSITDVSIHIRWENSDYQEKSLLADRLLQRLTELDIGLLNYSLWLEKI